jgi:hypothetical protein
MRTEVTDLALKLEKVSEEGKRAGNGGHVVDSIEKLKKGMDRFFTHYANQFEDVGDVNAPAWDAQSM